MKASALTNAFLADTDHVACFSRAGTEHRWQEFVTAASRVFATVAPTKGLRWALNLDDTFEFAAALLGCWAAGKVPVLAPRLMLEKDRSISFDGIIEATTTAVEARERILWPRLAMADERIERIAATADLVLYTSGSTGTPKEVCRAVHNVEAELAVLESTWGANLGSARVYSTVSHRHVYGLLFRVLWPILSRRPFATFDFEFPEQLADGRGAAHVLISSPALLKRIGHLPAAIGAWRAVFSSGGLLPREAAADAARVLGACPVEVLGSTETSGVAWRCQQPSVPASFVALQSVETRASADEFLEARSPFSGQREWLRMGDRVRFVGDGRFELLGRGDHLAKIEDKRVSLSEIERRLLESPWVKEAAAVPLEDASRQYLGAVLQLNASGAAELARIGRRAFGEVLKASLRTRVEAIALPRKFRYLEEMPVDSQGKRPQAVLRDLFGTRR